MVPEPAEDDGAEFQYEVTPEMRRRRRIFALLVGIVATAGVLFVAFCIWVYTAFSGPRPVSPVRSGQRTWTIPPDRPNAYGSPAPASTTSANSINFSIVFQLRTVPGTPSIFSILLIGIDDAATPLGKCK